MNNHFKQSDVLILSASYGGGHRSVSYAVADAIKYISPEIRVSVVDFYEILSPLFNRIIATTYVKIMKYIPSLYGLAYQLTYDLSADSIFNRILSKFGHEKFLEMLGVIKPKLILSSYPTYAGIISHLRKEKKADGISCIIITDFVAHSQWIYPDVDQYFVPSHEVKFHLIKKGIQSERIKVTGIPVHPRFLSEVDKGEVFRSYGLRKDVPILLVMAGIFGVTRGVREICEVIWDIPIDVQAVILCGEDKDLYSFLSKKHAGKMVPLSGFVNVHKLMSISYLLISKSGGITTSEAMAMGLPIIVYKSLSGQEAHNAELLSKVGAGIRVKNKEELRRILEHLLKNSDDYLLLKKATEIMKRPEAPMDIARTIISKLS